MAENGIITFVFLWLSNIPLCRYTTSFLSICLPRAIWLHSLCVSLFQIELQWKRTEIEKVSEALDIFLLQGLFFVFVLFFF